MLYTGTAIATPNNAVYATTSNVGFNTPRNSIAVIMVPETNTIQHRHTHASIPNTEVSRMPDVSNSDEMPTILLAEDNMINQKVALALLKKHGYSADVVLNGAEAVDAFGVHRYQIILMDINMPEMDGVEATQKIRSDFPSEEQPYVIAVTANAMKGDRERFLACGMDDYVSKPIRPNTLIGAIEQAITSFSVR